MSVRIGKSNEEIFTAIENGESFTIRRSDKKEYPLIIRDNLLGYINENGDFVVWYVRSQDAK